MPNPATPAPGENPVEPVDLAAMGKTWTAAQPRDNTSEVSAILTEMPWWVVQGMVYVILLFVGGALLCAHFSTVDVTVNGRGFLDAQSIAEIRVSNKDIGLIEEGLPAQLKFDAYPFQQYGAVAAKVIAISPGTPDADGNSFYHVTLAPQRTTIEVKSKTIPLRTGLSLTAEILTDRKTLLSILLEPIRGSGG